MARGVETIEILRPSGAAGMHGAPAPMLPPRTVEGCTLIPRTSTEEHDRQNTVIVGMTLVAPGGTDLLPTDEVVARGATWQVEGEPGDYRKRGRSKAIVAALKRVK